MALTPRAAAALCSSVLLFAAGLTACGQRKLDPVPSLDGDLWPGVGAWAERQLGQLSLEEKVSQLFAVSAYGRFVSDDDPAYRELVAFVEDFKVGGIIFFQGDPLSQALLANDLQHRARIPLLVSQDMEWGAGMRIDRTTTLPRTMALGATRDPELARAAGRVTAEEARALGTQQIFAPVADVNNNPYNPIINVRSFSEEPDLVARLVQAFVQGAQERGVLATAKHFPGHGDTAVDSHADLPVLPYTRSRLDSTELVPFRSAIASGVKSVMIGHLAFPALEPDSTVPASLSPRVTDALLRDDLGFKGLIVTDALNMQGVTKHFGAGETAVRALEAGADMLLMSIDPYAARDAVLHAVTTGRLTEDRIDHSVRRVLYAKEWARLHRNRLVDLDATREAVHTMRHRAVSETIARRSLTLLRNEDGLLPLLDPPARMVSITLSDGSDPGTGSPFSDALLAHSPHASLVTLLLDRRSAPTEYRAALDAAARADLILVPTFLYVRSWSGRISLPDDQREFLDALIATGKPVIVLSFGNPYMVVGLARQPAVYLAAYSGTPASQLAAADALFGESAVGGKLPVTIPGLYAYGEGLDLDQVSPRRGFAEEVGMDSRTMSTLDEVLHKAIDAHAFPGAALAVGRAGVLVKLDGYGHFTYTSETPVTPSSPFDLASLTKVIATTTAAMQLYEQGQLDLDAPVSTYLPAFAQNGKGAVTIRHLLTHTSGLPPFRAFHRMGVTTRQAVLDSVFALKLDYPTGSKSLYSDFSMITLALVVEAITEQPFDVYAREHIFAPLGMAQTGFRPVGTPDPAVVPTEVDNTFRHRLIQGEVHDETAWILGGVSGHAGLFSTAADLSRFAYMLVNGGRINGRQFLKEETIRLFTTPAQPDLHTRALGWDTKSPEGYTSAGQYFGPRSFGHTGFTGTSFWIDPDQQLFVILLTNRVYPTRENNGHRSVRPAVADLAYQAIQGAPALLTEEQVHYGAAR